MRASLVVVCVVALAVVAGCGGGGGTDGENASAPLTKQEFVKQGDAICQKASRAYAAKVEAAQSKGESNVDILKLAVDPLRAASREFRELKPSAEVRRQNQAILAALESAINGLGNGADGPLEEFQELAASYGFKVCG